MKNAAPFIEECVQSVIEQKGEFPALELIIINDHSTDGSEEVIADRVRKYGWISLVDNTGSGIIDALSTGLSEAQGTHISRMDADDRLPSRRFEALWKAYGKNSFKGVVTGKVKYFSTGKSLGQGFVAYQDWLNQMIDDQSHSRHLFEECVIASPNWIIDRESLNDIGGFGSIYPEDYDLVMRMFEARLPMAFTHEVTLHWRDHGERVSRNSEVYRDNSFVALKVKYFLKVIPSQAEVILVGAGKKGKAIARELCRNSCSFQWLSNNNSKVGHSIYDVIIESEEEHSFDPSSRYILAVSSPIEKFSLITEFESYQLVRGEHFFPFA